MSHCCNGAPGGGPGARPPSFRDDPETMERIHALEAEIADLAAQQEQCDHDYKELARREMVLATEIQHRKARINALLLTL